MRKVSRGELFTLPEAAAGLGLEYVTLCRWVHAGYFDHVLGPDRPAHGREFVVTAEELEEMSAMVALLELTDTRRRVLRNAAGEGLVPVWAREVAEAAALVGRTAKGRVRAS